MSETLERISIDKSLGHPLVTIREHLLRYVWALQNVKDKEILDIACGTGYGMYLMSYFAKSVSGYDYNKDAINEAKKFPYHCNCCLEIRNLEDNKPLSNYKHKKFDVITCFETIEHLENPERLLENIKNHLNSKGIFYFSTPNKKDLKDNSRWHKNAFNKSKWTLLLEKYFSNAVRKELWGQDQLGLSKNFNKSYIVGMVNL